MTLDFFFSPDRPIALVLNASIGVLMLVSFYELLRTWASLRTLLGELDQLGSAPSPSSGADLVALVDGQFSSPELHRRVIQLRDLGAARQSIDIEMLAAVSAERFRSAMPLSRWAASILVLLGLAGTLVGLSLALNDLSAVLDGSLGAAAMAAEILSTLGQMKIAFSTTLAGVTGAILVGSGVYGVRQLQSRAILELEDLTATCWVPLFDTTEAAQLVDAVKQLQFIRHALEEGLDHTAQSVLRGFDKIESELFERGTEILQQLEAVRDATLTIIGQKPEGAPSLAEYVETVKATTLELQHGVTAIGTLLPEMEARLQNAIRQQNDALESTLSDHTTKVVPILERQEEAAAHLNAAIQAEVGRLNEVHDILEGLSETMDRASATWAKADESIQKLGDQTADALRDGLGDALSSIESLIASHTDSQIQITRMLERSEATNAELVSLTGDQSRRTQKFAQEMVGEIRSAVQESLDKISGHLVRVDQDGFEKVRASVAEVRREIRDAASPPIPGLTRRDGHHKASSAADGAGGEDSAEATDDLADLSRRLDELN